VLCCLANLDSSACHAVLTPLALGLLQISSQKILTQTDLKGAVVGKGDFIASKLSPLVNSRTRNKLVLAAYLEHCTEPADGATLSAEEQWQQQEAARQHLERMSMRAAVVSTALQAKIRRDEAKQQQRLQEGQELKRRRGQVRVQCHSSPSTQQSITTPLT